MPDTEVEEQKKDDGEPEEPVAGEGETEENGEESGEIDVLDPQTWPTLGDMTGTLDTSGTGGAAHNNVDAVNPTFALARVQDLATAQKALDPEDGTVDSSSVVLPLPVAGEDVAELAKDNVDAAYATAVKRAEDVVNPEVVPGDWPSEQEGYEEPEEAEQLRVQSTADDPRLGTEEIIPTDLTGTLDTSGTGGFQTASATTISAGAVAEEAEEEGKTPAEVQAEYAAEGEEPPPLTGDNDIVVDVDETTGETEITEPNGDETVETGTDETETNGNGDEEVEPPARSALKGEWVDYVVANYETTREDAEAMTKEELVETYG